MKSYNFQVATEVNFGCGSINEIGRRMLKLNIKKVMIVTDKGVKEAGLLNNVIKNLEQQEIEYVIFDQVIPNPTVKNVVEGVKYGTDRNVDGLIAIGGGSPIDCAKAIAISYGKLDRRRVKQRIPLIAVPTTSGSGSEVTTATVVTDSKKHHKFLIDSQNIAPDIAFIDPNMTLTVPPKLTAATGMDVLTHSIEAYVSSNNVIPADEMALKSIKLICRYLRPAVGNGNNLEAREGMASASVLAGMAFTNSGLGLVHAIAHALGGNCNVPHGMANTILLPHVMRYNLIATPVKYAKVAEIMGVNRTGLTAMERAYQGIVKIEELMNEIELPTSLKEVGVEKDKLNAVVEDALNEKVVLAGNPRQVSSEDISQILKKAY